MMIGPRATNDFLTHITIYCPLTEERPLRYKESTTYDIRLFEEDFMSLQTFKNAIKERTRAGFLRSQFFRVTFDANLTDESHSFISDDDAILRAFDSTRKLPWNLIIVRYTKVQAARLREKLKSGEQDELDALTKQKRRYNRVSPRQKEVGQDTNMSASSLNGTDIYGSGDYVSTALSGSLTGAADILSSQGVSCATDLHIQPPVQLHRTVPHYDYGDDFAGSIGDATTSQARDLDILGYSSANYGSAVDSTVLSRHAQLQSWNTDDRAKRTQDIDEIVCKICEETPLSRVFSKRALELWAKKILMEMHDSLSIPPPSFPIPDLYVRHYLRNVSVQAEIQPICMLYATYLANRALKEAISSNMDEDENENEGVDSGSSTEEAGADDSSNWGRKVNSFF